MTADGLLTTNHRLKITLKPIALCHEAARIPMSEREPDRPAHPGCDTFAGGCLATSNLKQWLVVRVVRGVPNIMQIFLQTDRLALRRFTEADEEALFNLDSDPEVMRFLNGGTPTPRDIVQTVILPRFLLYDERCPSSAKVGVVILTNRDGAELFVHAIRLSLVEELLGMTPRRDLARELNGIYHFDPRYKWLATESAWLRLWPILGISLLTILVAWRPGLRAPRQD